MAESKSVDLDGPTHHLDFGGEGPSFVLIHGLGGSHANWRGIGDDLARIGSATALDLVGFGLTPPGLRGFAMADQRRLVDRFISATDRGPAILVGNSMGGLVSLLVAAAVPHQVAGLILVNPALPPQPGAINAQTAQRLLLPTMPFVGKTYLRWYFGSRTPERLVEETMALVCADPSRVPPHLIAASLEMTKLRRSMPWAAKAFTKASQSIGGVLVRRRAFVEMVTSITVPTLLVHGDRDVIVPPAAARWLAGIRPDWMFDMMDGVGHVPQIEVPDRLMATVREWLSGPGAEAAARAASVGS